MKLHHGINAPAGWLLLALALLSGAAPAGSAPTAQTEHAISHLIGHVSGSGMTFIRNGSEYTPQEAAEHMLKKYRHFRDDIDSAEDFIALCASKSLLSGKAYEVLDAQGKVQYTRDWLRAELATYRANRP